MNLQKIRAEWRGSDFFWLEWKKLPPHTYLYSALYYQKQACKLNKEAHLNEKREVFFLQLEWTSEQSRAYI